MLDGHRGRQTGPELRPARVPVDDDADGHPLDDASAGAQQRYKANLSFYPTERSRLRLQYGLEPPGVRSDTAHAVFLTLELAAGAHGAHQF